jgi:hypothetical protein
MSGSLATSTGPQGPKDWSVEKLQHAHVGENVRFQFVVIDVFRGVPVGNMADYVVWEVGGVPEVTAADPDGRYQLTHEMPTTAAGNVAVSATAYRMRGSQDTQVINGRLIQRGNPNDSPDAWVASDRLTVRVYQSEVRFDVPAQTPPCLWTTALLTFETERGVETILPQRPGRDGFAILSDDQGGNTVVTCSPPAEVLRTNGTTQARLLVQDEAGQQHVFETVLDTP